MKTVQVGEFKANFSSLLKEVDGGEVIEVTFGKSNEVKGYFVPPSKFEKKKVVLGLGTMMGAKVIIGDNFEFTDTELKELFDID